VKTLLAVDDEPSNLLLIQMAGEESGVGLDMSKPLDMTAFVAMLRANLT
jgi:hypothetical protein